MAISIRNRQAKVRVETPWLKKQARAILHGVDRPTADLSILLVDDAEMARLNQTYRAVAGPTDVLAFPMQEGRFKTLAAECLGDVVISVETAARQASDGLRSELALLLAHGILHLLGYDHGTARERAKMWKRQHALLAHLGLAVPRTWAE